MKILYVDDEMDLLELARSFFEDENLALETASSYEEALNKLAADHFDLLITDLRMPRGSGHELVSTVRERGHFRGKVILITGHYSGESDGPEGPYDLIVHKPVDFLDLVEKVKSLLAV